MRLFETINDLDAQADVVRRRRYGVIETAGGRLVSVRFRPWPRWITLPDMLFFGQWHHGHRGGDRCRLYFNQPRWHSNFLAVPYIVSGRGTQLATFLAAAEALDEIARIKRSDALLADILNFRLSRRFLARLGWEPHKPSRWHRHYIKRFYGQYPAGRRGSSASQPAECQHPAASISLPAVGVGG